jgi:hypothetical protein
MGQGVVQVLSGAPTLPKLFAPDESAARRFLEFFTANIRNPHTRRTYARAAVEFALRKKRSAGVGGYRARSCVCLCRDTTKEIGSTFSKTALGSDTDAL